MLSTILYVIALVLAIVSLFVTPRGHQLLAAAVICVSVGLLIPEVT
jgi:hypothetical protein